ncbi:MAG: CHAT domain-containing protein [Saprospiraceae bacterium]|nr:CHAT domain-containing protein [Saprospiraceae bacterium]
MAEVYLFMDSVSRAKVYFDQGSKLTNQKPEYQAFLFITGATLHIRNGHLDSAQFLTLQAMELFKNIPVGAENRLRSFTILAEIAQKKGNPAKAEQYYRQGLAEAKSNFKNKNREIAYLLSDAGVFYQTRGQLPRALECFQAALIQSFPNFNDTDFRQNPTLEAIPLESQALRAALGKAQVLLKMPAKSNEAEARRKNAAHCFDIAFAVATRLRQTYGNDADKLAQAASLHKDYQLAVLNLHSLYTATGDQLYLERLFSLIEQTKAQALTDALQQQRALALAGIPAEILEKEGHLRLELAAYTHALAEAELAKDSARMSDMKKQDRNPTKKYDGFLVDLQKRYPQFRKYLEAGVSADFPSVSGALPDSTALLSWFDAGDRYLLLGVFRGKLYYDHVMRNAEFDRRLSEFISLTADLNKQQNDPASFFREATFLGESLLPSFWTEARKLVIVPDGLLCYLPFEVLLTAPQAPIDYSSAPYLLRRCAVDYLWTAKLLVAPPLELHTRGLVHFAPFASAEPRNLPMLSHSLADVPESIGADRIEGVSATSTAFVRQAAQFQTIHLSTHAHAGRAGEPGIEFFDRRFPMQEVYAQRLRASLVCLSACETGVGVFSGGEGVLSLARAFAYAGAQSLVAGLWQVNDQATATIFSAFYENLKHGIPKSEALRQAKLAQLDAAGSDALKAPYYWAAFTFNGTDGVVDVSEKWTVLWYWMLGGLLLSLVLFWGWRGRRQGRGAHG